MTSQHAPSSPQAGTPWTLFRDLELLGVWGTCLVLFITDSCSDDVCPLFVSSTFCIFSCHVEFFFCIYIAFHLYISFNYFKIKINYFITLIENY